MTRVFVPTDAAALSMGAEGGAAAIAHEAAARGAQVELIRNGSRGMFWLEPLVEVETAQGRIAYGPVQADDVADLFESGWLDGGQSELCLGATEEIPYLKLQERLTFARCGVIDPLSLDDYLAHDGYDGLQTALKMQPVESVDERVSSG